MGLRSPRPTGANSRSPARRWRQSRGSHRRGSAASRRGCRRRAARAAMRSRNSLTRRADSLVTRAAHHAACRSGSDSQARRQSRRGTRNTPRTAPSARRRRAFTRARAAGSKAARRAGAKPARRWRSFPSPVRRGGQAVSSPKMLRRGTTSTRPRMFSIIESRNTSGLPSSVLAADAGRDPLDGLAETPVQGRRRHRAGVPRPGARCRA